MKDLVLSPKIFILSCHSQHPQQWGGNLCIWRTEIEEEWNNWSNFFSDYFLLTKVSHSEWERLHVQILSCCGWVLEPTLPSCNILLEPKASSVLEFTFRNKVRSPLQTLGGQPGGATELPDPCTENLQAEPEELSEEQVTDRLAYKSHNSPDECPSQQPSC